MKSINKIAASLVGVFGIMALTVFPVVQLNPVKANGVFNQYIQNETDYFYTRGSVTVNNMTVSELFAFTSDAQNDTLWYPGVISSVKTSDTTYTQSIHTGEYVVTSYLEILAEIPNALVVQKATGAFENYAMYVYSRGPNNSARLTIYSAVKKAEGITEEGLETLLNLTFPALLSYLGKTGTYSVHVI